VDLAIIIAVVAVALIFDYTNGFHDAANAIATSVSTRALTPRIALAMAAVMNFIGAFLGQEVANTVGNVITLPTVFATSCPRNAPMKFMTAAIPSATRGVSARVDTEVAIAFAASWNPLV
jgi:phosphate/sulfate permease